VNDGATTNVFRLEGGLSTPLAVGLGIVLVVEGTAIHLWVAERSQLWAWLIATLNVASLVWLWREVGANSLSRLVIDGDEVEITVGRRIRSRFSRSAVASADVATWRSVPDDMARDYVNTAKPLEPNVVIGMREPVDVRMALGIRKRAGRFGVRVRDPELAAALLRPSAEAAGPASRTTS
jgi:hypothetical protein